MSMTIRSTVTGITLAFAMGLLVGCKQEAPVATTDTATTASANNADTVGATTPAGRSPVIGTPDRPNYEGMLNEIDGQPSPFAPPPFYNLPKADPAAGYFGPTIGMRLIPPFGDARQSSAIVDFEAPTEGYTMKLDQSNLVDGVARIYVTIEMPPLNPVLPPNKTMHRDLGYSAADVVFTQAELWVRHYRKGEPTENLKWHLAGRLP